MQLAGLEVDIVPAQRHKLVGAQAMAIGDQDGGGVPVAPAVVTGSLYQLLDLALGQVLARATRSDCYI